MGRHSCAGFSRASPRTPDTDIRRSAWSSLPGPLRATQRLAGGPLPTCDGALDGVADGGFPCHDATNPGILDLDIH